MIQNNSNKAQIAAKLRVSDDSRHFIFDAKQCLFETSNSRLPPEDGSVRPETLGKCVSERPQHVPRASRERVRGPQKVGTNGKIRRPEGYVNPGKRKEGGYMNPGKRVRGKEEGYMNPGEGVRGPRKIGPSGKIERPHPTSKDKDVLTRQTPRGRRIHSLK